MTQLAGRRVLVTGSSRGVGLAIANRVRDAGAHIVLNSRDADALEALRHTAPDPTRVRALAFDITDDAGTAEAITWSVANWGTLDAAIHAVPARMVVDPSALGQDRFELALRALLSGTLNVSRAAAEAGVPRVIVIVPHEPGYARTALLGLVLSIADAWPGTRLIAASEAELAARDLGACLLG